jgi:hypothetical protein
MELQPQRSCVTPTEEDALVEASTAQRSILQERSANWPHEYHTQFASLQKPHNGLAAGFGIVKSEKQVDYELKLLYRILQRSEKYQKYREKQPVLTFAEVIARDAADRAAKAARKQEKTEEGSFREENRHRRMARLSGAGLLERYVVHVLSHYLQVHHAGTRLAKRCPRASYYCASMLERLPTPPLPGKVARSFRSHAPISPDRTSFSSPILPMQI